MAIEYAGQDVEVTVFGSDSHSHTQARQLDSLLSEVLGMGAAKREAQVTVDYTEKSDDIILFAVYLVDGETPRNPIRYHDHYLAEREEVALRMALADGLTVKSIKPEDVERLSFIAVPLGAVKSK